MGLGVQELLLILVIILIFFGAEKIPQLAKSLGKGITEFRQAQQDLKEQLISEPVVATTQVVPEITYQTCSNCHGQTLEGAAFCVNCGQKMQLVDNCFICGRQFLAEEKYCSHCGQARMADKGESA